jgi:hypothetical protein
LLTKEGDKDEIVDDDELNWQGREANRRHLLTDTTFSDRETVHKDL